MFCNLSQFLAILDETSPSVSTCCIQVSMCCNAVSAGLLGAVCLLQLSKVQVQCTKKTLSWYIYFRSCPRCNRAWSLASPHKSLALHLTSRDVLSSSIFLFFPRSAISLRQETAPRPRAPLQPALTRWAWRSCAELFDSQSGSSKWWKLAPNILWTAALSLLTPHVGSKLNDLKATCPMSLFEHPSLPGLVHLLSLPG